MAYVGATGIERDAEAKWDSRVSRKLRISMIFFKRLVKKILLQFLQKEKIKNIK